MIAVLPREMEKGVTIGTALGWGMAMGGIQRVSPVTTTVLSFIGAFGGMIGAMIAKDAVVANGMEGIAASSAGIFGLGITAPAVAKSVATSKSATGANKLLLKSGQAAQNVRVGSVAQVGAGLE